MEIAANEGDESSNVLPTFSCAPAVKPKNRRVPHKAQKYRIA
jgi:hypothetical protein